MNIIYLLVFSFISISAFDFIDHQSINNFEKGILLYAVMCVVGYIIYSVNQNSKASDES